MIGNQSVFTTYIAVCLVENDVDVKYLKSCTICEADRRND